MSAAENSNSPFSDDPVLQVVGGRDADINDYPFMGALVFDDPVDNSQNFCGCTAIDPYWVLTAAHCVHNGLGLDDFQIVFGTSDLENNATAQVFYPKAILHHPDYVNIYGRKNDIALIQLRDPLPPEIQPVTLATDPQLEEPGRMARLLGWGRIGTDADNPEYTEILQEVDLPIVSMEFANDPQYWNGRIKETMIAAGGTDPYASSGAGDSGGPLLAYNAKKDRWEQIGISSWGAGCSKPENPISTYTQVSYHVDWINNFVGSDFLSWTIANGITDLNFDDGDPYSILVEHIFSMDPTKADEPAWLNLSFERPEAGNGTIYTSITMRNNVPRFGLNFEHSTDLINWNKLNLAWEALRAGDYLETHTSRYLVPIIEAGDDPGFYRIRHEAYPGIHHGPFPLREGFETDGIFNVGTEANGPTRYDYLIENFGSDQPMLIEIKSDSSAPMRIQFVDVETDISTYDAIKSATEEDPLSLAIEPIKEKQNVVRVESTQWTTPQTFWIKGTFPFNNFLIPPGNTSAGTLSSENISYRRKGHYADSRSYRLQGGTNYKIEMQGEDLDPIFFLRDRLLNEGLFEIDNETPGKPEIFLFRPEEYMEVNIIVSSWYPEDSGDFLLNVDPYSEPATIKPGETITGFGTIDDEERLQGESKFYFDWYSMEDIHVPEGITVVVRGNLGYRPQFGVANDTTKETLFLDRVDCSVYSYFFVPEANNEYSVVVISNTANLGKNYEVQIYEGDLFDTEGTEENESKIKQQSKHLGPLYISGTSLY